MMPIVEGVGSEEMESENEGGSLCYLGADEECLLWTRRKTGDKTIPLSLEELRICECREDKQLHEVIDKVIQDGRYFYIGSAKVPNTKYLKITMPMRNTWKKDFEKKKTYYLFSGTGVTVRQLIHKYRKRASCVNRRSGDRDGYDIVGVLIGQKRPVIHCLKECGPLELSGKIEAIPANKHYFIGYVAKEENLKNAKPGSKEARKLKFEHGYYAFIDDSGVTKQKLVQQYKENPMCVNVNEDHPEYVGFVYVLIEH